MHITSILINLTPSNPPTVEVAIHTILYVRQIYPADLFVRRKKYETPVYQSRHPGLNEYIAGAVKAIGDELVLVSMPNFLYFRRHENDLFFNIGER
jgi:mitotic spindle assembly checkpoint protein MAD2B